MERLAAAASQVRIPTQSTNVYKDECVYSFTTAFSEDGLFVDLNSFLCFSKEFVGLNYEKTGHAVYLRIRKREREIERPESKPADRGEGGEPPLKKPSVLGINVPGGFTTDDSKTVEVVETYSIVLLPDFIEFAYPNDALPDIIKKSVAGVLASDSATRKEDLSAWTATQSLKPSKYANELVQLQNGRKIPPRGWKCDNCNLTENLWLNLTDGAILCGRRNWDGSGGNGHAQQHYEKTGYPLVVKLGTITKEGVADVYSYPEDDMMVDPRLKEHLQHWGINIAEMEKTDKTMAEMELDQNLNFDFSRIQESGKELSPLYGGGYTGMVNLGNTCYLSSVMQVLFSLPEFQEHYFGPKGAARQRILRQAPADATADLDAQMAKLAYGLLSGEHSKPASDGKTQAKGTDGVAPKMFKALVGKGHREFSTMAQQDALEFFQYLIELVDRQDKKTGVPSGLPLLFRFRLEDRLECGASHKVRYTYRDDNVLSLPIPTERATNLAEVAAYEARKRAAEAKGEKLPADDVVRPRVPLLACLEAFAAPEHIADFWSPAVNARVTAIKTTRLATCPDVLVVHARRFYVDNGWVPRKLDVFLDVPDELDIEPLRGHGRQPGEQELPEGTEPAATPAALATPAPSPEIVAALEAMGFPRVRCEKAAVKTNNAGVEQAATWLFEHMEDADIDVPLQTASKPAVAVSEEAVQTLVGMGFSRQQAERALKATDNNLERATDWIFSHMEEPMEVESTAPSSAAPVGIPPQASSGVRDGRGRYRLFALVSHMGTSTSCGHYVAHILKDGKWVIYNDAKVAVSENPPKELAYLYFYRRV